MPYCAASVGGRGCQSRVLPWGGVWPAAQVADGQLHGSLDPDLTREPPGASRAPQTAMASRVSRAKERPVNKVVSGLILLMAVLAWYQQDAPISGPSGGGPHLVATDCWFEPPEGFVVSCHR